MIFQSWAPIFGEIDQSGPASLAIGPDSNLCECSSSVLRFSAVRSARDRAIFQQANPINQKEK